MHRRRTLALSTLGLVLGAVGWWSTRPVVTPDASRSPRATQVESRSVVRSSGDANRAPDDSMGVAEAGPGSESTPVIDATEPRPGRRLRLHDSAALPGTPGEAARAALELHAAELGLERMPGELELLREFESLTGHHVRFRQVVDGVPVLRATVGVHVDREQRPYYLAADLYPLDGVGTEPAISPAEAKRVALDLLLDGDETREEATQVVVRTPELWLRPEGRGGRLVWRVTVRTADEAQRVLVDAMDGEPVEARSTRVAASGWAKVFDPNPVHSTRDTSLTDDRDRDSAALTDARVLVELKNLDGSGRLRGTWADLTFTPSAAFRTDLDWRHVTRDDPVFEQLVCYQVVNDVQEELQRLGLTNVNAERQACNAHANSKDQSFYDDDLDRMFFGDGGVDDAEDADIVRHEYGHAMQYDQVDGYPGDREGGAIGEGFGDFLAVAFRQSGNDLFDAAVGSWDATSYSRAAVPALRRVDGSKRYPDDLRNQVHADGEIWSRVLWDVLRTVGRDDALRLVIESHFLYTPNVTFRDAANALLSTNFVLRDGRHDAELRDILLDRGIFFSVPPRPPVDEDEYEPNDRVTDAPRLELGTYPELMLADEDWFTVAVPPNSRLTVTAVHDPDEVQLDLELRTTSGVFLAGSGGLDATEIVSLGVGADGGDVLVRVFDGSPGVRAGGYSLTLGTGPLEPLQKGESRLLTLDEGAFETFAIPVSSEDVEQGRRFVLAARKKGRRGGKMDLRVFDPNGEQVSDFGTGRKRFGTKLVLRPAIAGTWVVQVRPREGRPGRFKLKSKVR